MKRTTLGLLTSGLLLVPASPALAHAQVSHLTPKPGSTVKRATSSAGLRFSEAVLGGTITVTDAGGKTVSRSGHLVNGKTGLRASLSLHKGRFFVSAKWIADDGDKQHKRWSFTAR